MIAEPKQFQESSGKNQQKPKKASAEKGSVPDYPGKPGPKPWTEHRARLPIEQAKEFGRLRLSFESMGAICGVNEKTVRREFDKGEESEFVRLYKEGEAGWKMTLRTAMAQRAVEGSDSLAIFMAKNDLGMTDRPLVEIHNTQVTVTEEPLPTFLAN